jgi:serine/threonine-protein kinase
MTSVKAEPGGQVGVGSVVAGYRLVEVVGLGGSGTVYRAERGGQIVALKLLNAEHAHDEGERARFAREAEVVRKLAHPHVVALIDYGFAGHLPYLVFPFLEGRTLEKKIAAEGKLGWGLVGRFSEEVLSALEVAHAMGIVHRDLKPANIFCVASEAGESIRLLDFGTAKIAGRKGATGSSVTRAGMLIGTPRYMAPEQARGEELTPAADVYAFGLVMAEMLLGRPLVTGVADLDIYVMQGSDRPHVLPDDVRYSPYARIIERAVAKPLEVRYRLASQMLADVRAILSRYGRREAIPLPEADLEVTRFIGTAEPLLKPEAAEKLRKVFNAIADKAAAAASPPAAQATDRGPGPVAPGAAAIAPASPSIASDALPSETTDPIGLDAPTETTAPPGMDESTAPLGMNAPSPTNAPLHANEPIPTNAPLHANATVQANTSVQANAHLHANASPDAGARVAANAPHAEGPPVGAEPAHAPGTERAAPAPPAAPIARSPNRAPIYLLSGVLGLAVVAGGAVYLVRKRAVSGGEAPSASVSAPPAVGPSAAPSASAPMPPATAPPGAFSSSPRDRAPLARLLDDKEATLTPELYELALERTASCPVHEGEKPSCAELSDYESALKRSVKKKDRPARFAVAVKHLANAAPMVRMLAARTLASSDAPGDMDALLRAGKVEPQAVVLAEILSSMTRDRPDFVELARTALASSASPAVRAGACTSLGASPGSAPLEPIVHAARDDADAAVRTRCFAALTSLWVRTSPADPRKDAYDAMLAILEATPRDPAHLPEGLGRIGDARTSLPDDDAAGIAWVKKVKAFYEPKRVADALEAVATDAHAPVELRRAAVKAIGAVDDKERRKAVKKKIAAMTDDASREVLAEPKKP